MRSHKYIYNIIGKNIKKYRKKKNLTAIKLSKLSNLSYGYIKNLESDKVYATISIETLCLVAEILNINVIDLLKDE